VVDESLRPAAALARPHRSRLPRLALGALLLAGGVAIGIKLSGNATREPAAAPAAATPEAAAPSEEPSTLTMTAVAQRNIGLVDAPAEVEPILRTVRATGLVGFDDTRVVRVRPLARGRLLETRVGLGSRVTSGQIVATYDHVEISDLNGQLAVARAALAQARADAAAAHQALERSKQLVAVGGIARADLERRTADAARADGAVRMQEAEIATFGDKLKRYGVSGRADASPIRAPIDGVVVKLNVVPGELVDLERDVLTIADLSTVWVQADVLETDLPLVATGQDVSIAVAGYPDRRFAGTVTYVADMLDPKTNTARVRCAVANPDGALKLNMFATVEIAAPAGRTGVTVPAASLQDVDGKPVVFVRTGPESFERRDVRLGVETSDRIEIADGVKTGDKVVTTGSFQLKSVLLHDRIEGD
jgi:cobalt-zinc-cadmium efflux system membrane fusion protein